MMRRALSRLARAWVKVAAGTSIAKSSELNEFGSHTQAPLMGMKSKKVVRSNHAVRG
jgi:hypothetical protein